VEVVGILTIVLAAAVDGLLMYKSINTLASGTGSFAETAFDWVKLAFTWGPAVVLWFFMVAYACWGCGERGARQACCGQGCVCSKENCGAPLALVAICLSLPLVVGLYKLVVVVVAVGALVVVIRRAIDDIDSKGVQDRSVCFASLDTTQIAADLFKKRELGFVLLAFFLGLFDCIISSLPLLVAHWCYFDYTVAPQLQSFQWILSVVKLVAGSISVVVCIGGAIEFLYVVRKNGAATGKADGARGKEPVAVPPADRRYDTASTSTSASLSDTGSDSADFIYDSSYDA